MAVIKITMTFYGPETWYEEATYLFREVFITLNNPVQLAS